MFGPDMSPVPSAPRVRRTPLRPLALLLGLWMFVIPQALFSTTGAAIHQEMGRTSPLAEEEDLKEFCPSFDVPMVPRPVSAKAIDVPTIAARIDAVSHLDVSLRPPRAVAA